MFLFRSALDARSASLGQAWADSLTLGAGQFCTNPGIAMVMRGPAGDAFIEAALAALSQVVPQAMLTEGIAAAYRAGCTRMATIAGVQALLTLTSNCGPRMAAPYLFRVSASEWLGNHALAEEVFCPLGLVVTVDDLGEMWQLV